MMCLLVANFLNYCTLIGLLLTSPLGQQCSKELSFGSCFPVWLLPICLIPIYLVGYLIEAGMLVWWKLCGSDRSFLCTLFFHAISCTMDFFVLYIVIKNDITDLYPADIALVVFVGLVPLVSMVISWLVWRVREDNSDTVYSQGVLLKNLETYLNEKF